MAKQIILIKSEVLETAWEESAETFDSVRDEIKGLISRWEKENSAEVLSLVMAGTVGRWDGNSIGGKHVDIEGIMESEGYDDLEVYFNEQGELEFRFMHHDGSHYMNLYLMTIKRLNNLKLNEDGDMWDAADYQKVFQYLNPLKDDGEFNPGWELYEK